MQEWKLKTMPFTVIPKKMKYLGISLTKNIQDPCTENYKMLIKKKIKDLNKETELYVNYDLKIKKEEETHWVMGRKTLHNKHDNSPQITGVI